MAVLDTKSIQSSPKWTEDETILAYEAFLIHELHHASAGNPIVKELSLLLRAMTIHPPDQRPDAFRNSNGVARKIQNLEYVATNGEHGSANVSDMDRQVHRKFKGQFEALISRADAIRSLVISDFASSQPSDHHSRFEAIEGRQRLVTHLIRERDPNISHSKKAQAKNDFNRLSCEVCGFDFERVYGSIGEDYIECHHIVPISQLQPGQPTRLEDLALLCANCHRMAHSSREPLSMADLRARVERSKESTHPAK